MRRVTYFTFFLLYSSFFIFLSSCKSNKQVETSAEETVPVVAIEFNGDSALAFCQKQCDFGPRVMNSTAHDKCGEWIVNKFKEYGLTVETQKADLTGWDGKTLHSMNIIAHYNPQATERYLVCAHWDSRPWADNDPDSTNWHKPVMAANDAASGVAVMLEIARDLNANPSTSSEQAADPDSINPHNQIGIDFVCFDAEDYGTPQWADVEDDPATWALGAQYFANNLPDFDDDPNTGGSYSYGILLDMVGGQGSKFYKEGYSQQYASSVVGKIWAASEAVGVGSYFENQNGGTITDDHKPLIDAGIATVDIIPYYPDCQQSSFGPTWHTVSDDMQHMDKQVLKAVGQTVIQTLFSE